MVTQPGEVNCIHGVGHKADIHGCDGCCSKGLAALIKGEK